MQSVTHLVRSHLLVWGAPRINYLWGGDSQGLGSNEATALLLKRPTYHTHADTHSPTLMYMWTCMSEHTCNTRVFIHRLIVNKHAGMYTYTCSQSHNRYVRKYTHLYTCIYTAHSKTFRHVHTPTHMEPRCTHAHTHSYTHICTLTHIDKYMHVTQHT